MMQTEPPKALTWVAQSGGRYPPYAVAGGYDSNANLYVARAGHAGGVIVGKVHPGHTHAYVSYGGRSHSKYNYEVLTAPPDALSWVECMDSDVPENAVIGGTDPSGAQYHIGRVRHNGTLTIGKIINSQHTCYIAYGDFEYDYYEYEVLVLNPVQENPDDACNMNVEVSVPEKVTWVAASNGNVPAHAVRGGIDGNLDLYVARANHAGGLIVGKLVPSQPYACLLVPYRDGEHAKRNYEVLTAPPNTLSWVRCDGHVIPNNAIVGGTSPRGETYCIGRVTHNGTVTVGKVLQSKRICVIGYGGREHEYENFEILVVNAVGKLLKVYSPLQIND